MTTPKPETTQQPEQSPPPPSYRVSYERLAELKRSAVAVMADRRPRSCPSRQTPDYQLTDPQKLVDEIAEHYAEDGDFISTRMPVQEIVFRTLLARRNTLTPLRELHYELTERWSTPVRPINFTEEGLARILDSDTYYGFIRVDQDG